MKTIVISGASRGLGKGLAVYLSKKYKIITFARGNAECQIDNVTHIPNIDATSLDDLKKLETYLKNADGLINNVGIAFDGLLATQGIDSIEKMVGVNLLSVLYLTKLYTRLRLQEKQSGNVVSISSIISIRGFSGVAVYSATKGAINSMTKSLAREMGKKGFRFNAVLPGYFESELSKNLSPKKQEQIIRRTPLGRLAKIEDICPLVAFLLSEKSDFITGQLITVDGGLTS